jgi:hypothetical protein
MKRILLALAVGGVLLGGGEAVAKKKPPKAAGEVKKEKEPQPGPGDKGTNEGGQGRQNATEDAARAAEGSNNSRGGVR